MTLNSLLVAQMARNFLDQIFGLDFWSRKKHSVFQTGVMRMLHAFGHHAVMCSNMLGVVGLQTFV